MQRLGQHEDTLRNKRRDIRKLYARVGNRVGLR